jgi:hypothetical protein
MAVYTRNNIVTNGLTLYLDAANRQSYVSGSTLWRDVSGNNISGSLINGPTFSSIYGGSIVFDGVNDRFQASNIVLPISSSFTIEYAVSISELPTTGEYNYIYQNGAGYQTSGVYAEFGDGPFMSFCTLNSSSAAYSIGLPTVPQANRLYYVTATYNNRNFRGYLNGILINNIANIGFDPLNSTSTNFFIGSIGPFTIPFWRFYNRTLSQAEVTQNYNALKTRFGLT